MTVQIAISQKIRAIGVKMDSGPSDGDHWPKLVIGGNTLEEILARADLVMQACAQIKAEANRRIHP